MDVFTLHDAVIPDYADYVRSFVTVRDSKSNAFINEQFTSGVLWPEVLLELNPGVQVGPAL